MWGYDAALYPMLGPEDEPEKTLKQIDIENRLQNRKHAMQSVCWAKAGRSTKERQPGTVDGASQCG